MENLISIISVAFAIFLAFKLNTLVTTIINVILTVVGLTAKSTDVYATDVEINLAKKRSDQLVELNDIGHIPTTEEINAILAGKKAVDEKDK